MQHRAVFRRDWLVAAIAAPLVLAACSGHPSVTPPAKAAASALRGERLPGGPARANQTTPILHVIWIMQENRGFNNLFQGYPGADTVASGKNSSGQTIALQPISLAAPYDIDHSAGAFFVAYDNGKMDGFDQEYVCCSPPNANPQYGYVPHSESQPYFNMASRYVLADRMFTSNIDGSFISHQYFIAGYASHAVNFPSGIWGCGGGSGDLVPTLNQDRSYGPNIPTCMNNQTLGDELDAAGLSWQFYTDKLQTTGGLWTAYRAIRHIRYGPDWKKILTPPGRFLTDVGKGSLANVTWITPTWPDSDHSGNQSTTGPQWITSIVNAVGRSPFWNTSAIFITWDEWGGWYDHLPPPYVDYDGLGIRIPLLIISPYAKKGYVTHVQYEHGSILRFIEDNWGLAHLAASDTRANDPASDAFNFAVGPRRFAPFAAKFPDSYFVNEKTNRAPDSE
jgi:phospholipase C